MYYVIHMKLKRSSQFNLRNDVRNYRNTVKLLQCGYYVAHLVYNVINLHVDLNK